MLAAFVFAVEFRRKTPYLDLLPSWAQFRRHPWDSLHQVWTVYAQHVAWESEQTALARERNIEDARKRKAYRVAHGLEQPDHGLQGGVPGVQVHYGEMVGMPPPAEAADKDLSEAEKTQLREEADFENKVKQAYRESIKNAGGDPDAMDRYLQSQDKPRETKKWLGIW